MDIKNYVEQQFKNYSSDFVAPIVQELKSNPSGSGSIDLSTLNLYGEKNYFFFPNKSLSYGSKSIMTIASDENGEFTVNGAPDTNVYYTPTDPRYYGITNGVYKIKGVNWFKLNKRWIMIKKRNKTNSNDEVFVEHLLTSDITLNVTDADIYNYFFFFCVTKDTACNNLKFKPECNLISLNSGTLTNAELTKKVENISNNSGNSAPQLEDLRTDRRLIWHEEFEEFDPEKWHLNYADDSGKGAIRINNDSAHMTYNNSVLTMNTLQQNGVNTIARMYSRQGFRNCLIEIKARGHHGTWLNNVQQENSPKSNDIGYSKMTNGAGCRYLEIDLAEYYGDGDKKQHCNIHVSKLNHTEMWMNVWGLAETSDYDDWHIWGLDMVDEKTFDIYIDREFKQRLVLDSNVVDTNILKDTGLYLIIDSPTNAGGEDLTGQWDWIRIYENAHPENYNLMATKADLMSWITGEVYENVNNDFVWLPSSIIKDHTDEWGTYKDIALGVKFSPANTYICPSINTVLIHSCLNYTVPSIDNLRVSVGDIGGSLEYVGIEIITDIGTLRGMFSVGNFVPYDQQAVGAEFHKKYTSQETPPYSIKLKDVATGDNLYLIVANGIIGTLKEEVVAHMLGL